MWRAKETESRAYENESLDSLVLILLLIYFAGLSGAQAVSPAPDGCYPNFTTAEGCNALDFLTTGSGNSGLGWFALSSNTTGSFNTGVGAGALTLNNADSNTAVGAAALLLNTTGTLNVAVGTDALVFNDSGYRNNAVGTFALYTNTDGYANNAIGYEALYDNTSGFQNAAIGGGALFSNTTGSNNVAVGTAALYLNSTGSSNTAVGMEALYNNTVAGNTATGFSALFANTIGGTLETSITGHALGPNTAIGNNALESNVDGSACTAVGYQALHNQVHGLTLEGDPHFAANTAVGFEALANVTGSATGVNAANDAEGYQALFDLTDGSANVGVGALAGTGLTTGSGNIAVGSYAGIGLTSGNLNIFIGTNQGAATATESFHTYIANINSTNVSGAGTDTVTIDLTTGLLGHLTSSRRYKEEIKPMDKASEKLYRLKPVTYRYKKEIDRTQSLAFGLIAEEVAEVNPGLVACNAQGQPESVHYEAVNAMLLNEFLKEHRTVQEQGATITELKKQIAGLTAGLQKVSAQLEASKTAPQTVSNDH